MITDDNTSQQLLGSSHQRYTEMAKDRKDPEGLQGGMTNTGRHHGSQKQTVAFFLTDMALWLEAWVATVK